MKLLLFAITLVIYTALSNAKVAVIPQGDTNLIVIPVPQEPTVITVAKTDADFENVRDALQSITDASFINRYTIQIGPGVFEHSSTLFLKDHVDIIGSGQFETVILGSVSGNGALMDHSAVVAARNGTIENLTIRNAPTSRSRSSLSIVLLINRGGAPRLSNIGLSIDGGPDNTGIHVANSNPKFTNMDITLDRGHRDQVGIEASGADIDIDSVRIIVQNGDREQYGVRAHNSSLKITNSTIEVSTGLKSQFGVSSAEFLISSDTNVLELSDTVIKVEGGGRPDREFGLVTYGNTNARHTITASRIEAPLISVKAEGDNNNNTSIADSVLVGDVVGPAMCSNVVTGDMATLDANCQRL